MGMPGSVAGLTHRSALLLEGMANTARWFRRAKALLPGQRQSQEILRKVHAVREVLIEAEERYDSGRASRPAVSFCSPVLADVSACNRRFRNFS
jgi:hypothetical protein